MENKKLDELLGKYYRGETTVEEEGQIMESLDHEDIGLEYRAEKEQFAFFQHEQEVDLPEEFEEKIEKIIKGQKETKEARIMRFNWQSVAAVLLAAMGLSLWFLKYDKVEWRETATLDNSQSELVLADGSMVSINSNSMITYPETFDRKREIYFQGEGYFDIVPSSDRPFLIHMDNTLVEVLGTSFNLRSYAEEPTIEVSVISGKVSFSSLRDGLHEKVILQKGEQARYNKLTDRIEKYTLENENQIAWKTKKLSFDDQLMGDVIKDLERYFDVGIEVDDQTLLNCHFKGEFNDGRLGEILEVLNYSMGISYQFEGRQYILYGEGCIGVDVPN